MTFTSEVGYIDSGVIGQAVSRALRMHYGKWANDDGSTGGDIDTALAQCVFIKLDISGATASATVPVVNESFPCGAHVTVVTPANASGYWVAFEY